MNDQKFRNHPTVIINNIVAVAFILFITCISIPNIDLIMISIFLLILALATGIFILAWRRTTITFEKDQIVVEHNLIYLKRKTIPYAKIASVNVVRNIFNRIFGTTTVNININSSKNAAIPEASFAFKSELANKIRSDLSSKIFEMEYTSEEDENFESVAIFTPKDVLIHGLLATSTWQLIYTFILLVYSVLSIFYGSAGGLIAAISLLIIGEIIPVVSLILKFYNFKVYRVGDNIRIQNGAIQTYRTSFDVSRINAVRIRRPFFARLLHKSCLEAEVVGINAAAKDTKPTLCLLIDDNKMEGIMKQLVPEFLYQPNMTIQPKKAIFPLLSKTSIAAFIFLIIMAYPCYWMYTNSGNFDLTNNYAQVLVQYLPIICTLIVILALYWGALVSYKVRQFGLGIDMFTMINGILDRETVTIQYDRVQITKLSASMMAKRFNLARCTISLLSSVGEKRITSGYFYAEELEEVGKIVLDRLSNGKYDYRKTTI